MKKYSFLVYHKEYLDFLKGIQDIGVVHIIEKGTGEIEDEAIQEKYQALNNLKNAIKFLEKRDVEDNATNDGKDAFELVTELKTQQSEIEANHQKLGHLSKEQSLLLPWGNFDWDTLAKLNEAGYTADFYTCPARNFKAEWEAEYAIEQINELGGTIYFILIRKNDEAVEINAESIKLPQVSLQNVKEQLKQTEQVIANTEQYLNKFAANRLRYLKDIQDKLIAELDFDKVLVNTQKEAEEKLMFLEGWVPDEVETDVEDYLNKSGIYYESAKPELDEAPPIKLKNSQFAKLFESIGELYTFPNYRELDLTPFFAPFYMLFFGFCLGDAGYGAIIVLATLIGLRKAKPSLKPLFKLGFYLGLATIVMGIVGGTFFGILLHPENHEAGTVFSPWITKYQKYIVSSDNLMKVALIIGYIQVLFGMFLNAANRIRLQGFKYAISQFGWNIIVLVTIPFLGLSKFGVVNAEIASKVVIISGIAGAIPALFYNTPGKNPLLNLGTGLWNAYGVASGLLGDVLSYIRLFALGLSSAILGNVFNQLAVQSSEGVGGIFGIIILILILAFGHSLNFFMAALGSFVHPLRLTFVEFYKNADFMGGGRKYEPFKK